MSNGSIRVNTHIDLEDTLQVVNDNESIQPTYKNNQNIELFYR